MKSKNESNTQERGEVPHHKNGRCLALAMLLCLLAVLMLVEPILGIMGIVWTLLAFFGFRMFFFSQNKKTKEEISFFSNTAMEIPKGLPLPYAYLDSEKQVIGYNEKFSMLLGDRQLTLEDMGLLFADIDPQVKNQLLYINGESYQCFFAKQTVDEQFFYSMLLADGSETSRLQKELEGQKPVVVLLYLDNYEEVVDSLDDNKTPALTAIIDKKLSDMTVNFCGVMKKFEKDRYVFLFNTSKLLEMQSKKFEILHEIREIKVGRHIPVTLSMGVGMGGSCLSDTMQNARAAIDLALGRGGDQVLVKDGENYKFYGGKSGGVIHNSRIRARVKADALWELMSEAPEILIMGHKQGDLDSLGASIGVYAIAKALGRRSFIILDQVSGGIRKLCDRIAEDTAYGNPFISGAEAIKMVTTHSLVVVTDTHRRGMTECPALLDEAKKIILFDHHRKSVDAIDKAVMIYHDPSASSTAELVTEMIQYYDSKINLKPLEADALLAGITLDTKNFCVKAGAITFETAAYLRRNGADSVRVRRLFQNNLADYQAKAAAVSDAELYLNDIAISVCHATGENATLTAAQAADDLLNVTDIRAAFVLCKSNDTVYISARSFDEINVQRIMERLDGGGHLTVAGAQLPNITIEEAEGKVKEAILQYLEEEES